MHFRKLSLVILNILIISKSFVCPCKKIMNTIHTILHRVGLDSRIKANCPHMGPGSARGGPYMGGGGLFKGIILHPKQILCVCMFIFSILCSLNILKMHKKFFPYTAICSNYFVKGICTQSSSLAFIKSFQKYL